MCFWSQKWEENNREKGVGGDKNCHLILGFEIRLIER